MINALLSLFVRMKYVCSLRKYRAGLQLTTNQIQMIQKNTSHEYVMLFITVIYDKSTKNYAGLQVLSVNHVSFAPT